MPESGRIGESVRYFVTNQPICYGIEIVYSLEVEHCTCKVDVYTCIDVHTCIVYSLTTVGTSYSIPFVSSIKWPHCTEVSACTGPDGVVCTSRGEVRMRGGVWVRVEV